MYPRTKMTKRIKRTKWAMTRRFRVRPGRPSKAQRLLALAHAGRVRKALEGFRLTDSLGDLRRLRDERLRARG